MHIPDFEIHEAASMLDASRLLSEHAPGARVLAGGTDLLVDLKSGRDTASTRHLHPQYPRVANDPHGRPRPDDWRNRHACRSRRIRRVHAGLPPHWRRNDSDGGHPDQQHGDSWRQHRQRRALRRPPPDPHRHGIASVDARIYEQPRGRSRSKSFSSPHVRPLGTTMRCSRPSSSRHQDPCADRHMRGSPCGKATPSPWPASQPGSTLTQRRFSTRSARISMSAVAPTPGLVEVGGPERSSGVNLTKQPLRPRRTPQPKAAQPICDVRGSAEFRLEIVGVLTRRAVKRAHERAKEAAR